MLDDNLREQLELYTTFRSTTAFAPLYRFDSNAMGCWSCFTGRPLRSKDFALQLAGAGLLDYDVERVSSTWYYGPLYLCDNRSAAIEAARPLRTRGLSLSAP